MGDGLAVRVRRGLCLVAATAACSVLLVRLGEGQGNAIAWPTPGLYDLGTVQGDWHWDTTEYGVRATGTVTNISGRDLPLIEVEVTWYRPDGSRITHDTGLVAPTRLRPGEMGAWQVYVWLHRSSLLAELRAPGVTGQYQFSTFVGGHPLRVLVAERAKPIPAPRPMGRVRVYLPSQAKTWSPIFDVTVPQEPAAGQTAARAAKTNVVARIEELVTGGGFAGQPIHVWQPDHKVPTVHVSFRGDPRSSELRSALRTMVTEGQKVLGSGQLRIIADVRGRNVAEGRFSRAANRVVLTDL